MFTQSSTGRLFTPNEYRTDGNIAYLLLPSKDGVMTETAIDAADLARALAFGRWNRTWSKYTRSYYAICLREGGTGLHRLVVNAPRGMDVDHRDHDTLNNRRDNLLVCTRGVNLCNRLSSRRSKSGIPHVYWDAKWRKWVVGMEIDRRSHYFGAYATIEEAEQVAKVKCAALLSQLVSQLT